MAAPLIGAGILARVAVKKLAKRAATKNAAKSMHPRDPTAAQIDRGIEAFRRDAKKITQQSDRRMAGALVGGTAAAVGAGVAAEKLKLRLNRQRDR